MSTPASLIQDSKAFHIEAYYGAPSVVREAIRYLYSLHSLKIKTKAWKLIFIKIERIYHFIATKCFKTIKRAISYIRNKMPLSLTVLDRYHESGRQAENGYVLMQGFVKALDFLSVRNRLFTADKSTQQALIEEAKRLEKPKMSPSPPQKCPPYIRTPLNQARVSGETENHKLKKLGIPEEEKRLMSRYPERAIEMALEDVAKELKEGFKPRDAVGWLWYKLRKYAE